MGPSTAGGDPVRSFFLTRTSLPHPLLQVCRIALRNVHPDADNRHPSRYGSVRLPLSLAFLTPSNVSSRFPIEIPPETRIRLIRGLDSWHFEPHKLPDEEVLFCAQILFESLFQMENMQNDTGVSLSQCGMRLVTFRVPPHALMTQMIYQSSSSIFDVCTADGILITTFNTHWMSCKHVRLSCVLQVPCLRLPPSVAMAGHGGQIRKKAALCPVSEIWISLPFISRPSAMTSVTLVSQTCLWSVYRVTEAHVRRPVIDAQPLEKCRCTPIGCV